jgi:hypothetical protein
LAARPTAGWARPSRGRTRDRCRREWSCSGAEDGARRTGAQVRWMGAGAWRVPVGEKEVRHGSGLDDRGHGVAWPRERDG